MDIVDNQVRFLFRVSHQPETTNPALTKETVSTSRAHPPEEPQNQPLIPQNTPSTESAPPEDTHTSPTSTTETAAQPPSQKTPSPPSAGYSQTHTAHTSQQHPRTLTPAAQTPPVPPAPSDTARGRIPRVAGPLFAAARTKLGRVSMSISRRGQSAGSNGPAPVLANVGNTVGETHKRKAAPAKRTRPSRTDRPARPAGARGGGRRRRSRGKRRGGGRGASCSCLGEPRSTMSRL